MVLKYMKNITLYVKPASVHWDLMVESVRTSKLSKQNIANFHECYDFEAGDEKFTGKRETCFRPTFSLIIIQCLLFGLRWKR